jgi:chromate transporter
VVVLAALVGFWLLKVEVSVAPAAAVRAPMPHTAKPVLLILGAAAVLLPRLCFAHRPIYDLATMRVRIDLFAFGGGFAFVPLLFNEVVTVRQWLEGPTLLDGIVLGQVTPEPIVITATFVGYLLHGIGGALVATVAVFLPSFLIVIAVAPHFDRLRSLPAFSQLIRGALCAFPGLLLIITMHFAQSVTWDLTRLLLTGVAFVSLRLGANISWVVVIGVGVSLGFYR